MRNVLLGIVLCTLIAVPATACGSKVKGKFVNPPLAARIDDLLPQSSLSEADLEKVRALRAQVAQLAAAHKGAAARKAEEEAMRILGYRKVWLKCGEGSFAWMKS